MSQSRSPKHRKTGLLAIACAAPILFAVSMPWLDDQADWLVLTAAAIMGLIVMAATLSFAALSVRQTDEWHRGAQKFGAQWGWPIGAAMVPLIAILPPVQELIAQAASSLDESMVITQNGALMIFMMGFVVVVVMQAVCTMIATVAWRVWMSRAV